MTSLPRRLPVSSRFAFQQAFHLALRDPIHSLLIPFALRAPWAVTLALLPPVEESPDPARILGIASVAAIGDFLTMLVVSSMLRVRARSVFNAPGEGRPAPASECYGKGVARVPRLFLTEVLRNALLGVAASFSILPALQVRFHVESFFQDLSTNFLLLVVAGCLLIPTLFLGFRLAVATEAVVLHERTMVGAIQRSFRVMEGRFERWFELLTTSATIVITVALLTTLVTMPFQLPDTFLVALFWILVIVVTPVIQYGWTFFYLRLVEIDEPPFVEAPPMYASTSTEASPDPQG